MFDVIVIGSGLGGLITAACLAKSGWKVVVLEKHFIHGGFATSFRRRKHWEFDVSLHCLSGLGEKGRVRMIFEHLGIMERIRFNRMDPLYTAVFPDSSIIVPADHIKYREQLIDMFPEEREGITELFEIFIKIREEMVGLSFEKLPVSYVKKYKNHTLQNMLDDFIQSPKLQSILSQLWGYFGLPPDRLSALYFAYAWVDYHIYGGFYPESRSQHLSDALRSVIEENGGEVFLRQEAMEIHIREDKTKEIVTKKGDSFKGRIVVSNIDPKQMLAKLRGVPLPKRLESKVNSIEPSNSCVQAYFIVDGDLKRDYNEANHEIFINPDYNLNDVENHMRSERYDAIPIFITVYDNMIPEYQKNDVTTITMMQICKSNDWLDLDEEQYRLKKQAVLQSYLQKLEQLYPSISSKIQHQELATPKTIFRYTNHSEGAIYGTAQTVDQAVNRGIPQTTPIEGLYLVGAWSKPGAGYSGVISGGYNLSQIIKKEYQKEAVVKGKYYA